MPGNHDYWSKVPFDDIEKCFASSGGAWLLDQTVVTRDGKFSITGASNLKFKEQAPEPKPGTRHILLMHYPAWVKKLGALKFDLILTGHSHGGQVRVPFTGIDRALGGRGVRARPVSHGRWCSVRQPGPWFPVPIRFNSRPEITVFEI
jgi:predicted MPP superfamily phosphohydrolase